MIQKILSLLNSDRIHKARKAIGAGVTTTSGILIGKATSGQSVSTSDIAYAVGAGVAAALLIYWLPNRVVVPALKA